MSNIAILLAFLAITAAVGDAADHVVGDSTGWVVPGRPSLYSVWADRQTFAVGDNLVFNFAPGMHTVARTTKAGYDSCDLDAVTNTISTAPAEVTLDAAGEYYFICSVPGHCSVGQKLAVTVGASLTVPTPDASPAPSSSTAAPSQSPSQSQPDASPAPSEAQTAPPTASPAPSSEAPSAMTPVPTPTPSEAPTAMTPAASPTPSQAPSAATPEASSPSGSVTPTPEASPSPSGSDNPMAEPPASSASSLGATFSLALISAAVALFY